MTSTLPGGAAGPRTDAAPGHPHPDLPPGPCPADPPPVPPLRRRIVAMSLWSAAFVAAWLLVGLPTDPVYAFVWLWTATIAWNSAKPWRSHLGFARDWLPVVAVLIGYNISRGFADNGAIPHVLELIAADRLMFGWATGGDVPTVWLQERLYHPDAVHWWDVVVSWVYFSHFVVALAAAAVLWLSDRGRWAAYMRRFVFLSVAGLVTYFLYPAAPPWWASKYGLLEDVARISTRGWKVFGMHGAGNVLNAGQIAANPVAAMPSLHTAFALFVVAFFLTTTRRRWWPLLLTYPLAMTFTLVYSGEHYIIDVLVGWVYVGLTFGAVGLGERWWAARAARAGQATLATPKPQAAHETPAGRETSAGRETPQGGGSAAPTGERSHGPGGTGPVGELRGDDSRVGQLAELGGGAAGGRVGVDGGEPE